MSPKDKAAKAAKIKRLSEQEIFLTAFRREGFAQDAAKATKDKSDADKVLIDQIHRLRKVGSLESSAFGPFTRITVVAPEQVVYDGDSMKKVLTPAQRRAAFDRNINLNALDADARKRVLDVLSAEERKAVTTETLNTDKLSQAVQSGLIDAKVVAKFSSIKEIAPSIRISHGTK